MNRIVTSSEALSDRERAVAERFAAGMTYREIGQVLFIAPSTVRTHLAAIYEKLGVSNKVALARRISTVADTAPAAASPDASPVLAVFPIECLSGDESWRRFAEGLSSDITIDLARYAGIPVIAFHTMKSLGSKPADFAADGKALGAAYLVSGQLRADDTRVRLTVELADAASGLRLWSERFERPVENLFALQDGLTDSVVNALAGCFGAIATAGRNAIRRKQPASLRAYDLYLLGVEQHNKFSREGNAEAIRLFTRALELDPTLAKAWLELGYAYSIQSCNGFGGEPKAAAEKWRMAVENALQLDPTDSAVHVCLGDAMGCLGDLAAAERCYRRAFEYGSNQADTLALLAGSRALVAGDPAEAIPLMERAMQLNPLAPPWYFGMQGRILFVAGRYREAIAALRRSTPDSTNVLMFQALAHAAAGEDAEAAGFGARLNADFPDFSVEGFIAGYPVVNPDAVRAIRDAAKLVAIR
ncbi:MULTISPECIES: LuxR C-terminal-related transcriptional regulator [unclassified Mesorhizobium]|jgi:TolB-like protein/Tfp pilus assembly protein PilF|uniref:LuxR C-terminal-related transcriptional regulator n=1 Tax=unclassified Mesorhizobium TaxID=325217 RepID=UPI000FD8F62B|nr:MULTISPECIES: LuxR C-terminal-related transcriptional regulator [unclassified Mesorhizobium]TGQ12378.1 tetratricopeptide repeat protein [Mesorhizobium sp. M2E.F.Ca.ET.219.01.1.1]TGT68199.1 tetratricopeptide repeat protein [Mesorhizobium sp. M2E.F.Ca.ET.166.01.1.1]TGW01203.1 tetratricopeptide repeat protein [Mesorhizobium sp. M2E.F.Ca.ET.154.01.1.1]